MNRVIRVLTHNPRALVAGTLVLAAAFWFSMGATALYAYQVLDGVPDRGTLGRVAEMPRASIFYDHKNQPAFSISKEQRIEVPIEQMSPALKQAILAIEDQRFYDHQGVDVIRIAGAAIANLRAGRRGQGASTITQQLARLSFLTTEKTYTRKLQEALLAALIESEYTKEQILELYLNKVYFGSGFYGAEAAALGYFGKHASELNVPEAAMLAGLVKAPSNYAPTVDLERALKRRTVVLQAMRDMGVIDQPTFERARDTKAVLNDALNKEEPYGRFFKEHIRRELVSRFGEARVYEGGLKVYTTIDVEMQRAADAEVQRVLADLDKRRSQARRRSRRDDGSAAGLAHRHGSAERGSARIDRRPRLHPEQLQPRHRRQAAAGLGVQAVRLRRRPRGRLHAGDSAREPRRADRDGARARGSPRTATRRQPSSRCVPR